MFLHFVPLVVLATHFAFFACAIFPPYCNKNFIWFSIAQIKINTIYFEKPYKAFILKGSFDVFLNQTLADNMLTGIFFMNPQMKKLL